ncbi:MBL fold metallo-hydrolase [Motilimonas sp. 1_MG-2023]|uniref:MBL fold metallo-hydrolase n=1 Tax=Motilimonas sp. 1_MG-2023 TaxID=3062672 RepID=UPI0026E19CFF|nr:MBL fold metallo-hydrolase [Motilimonas sp. 1_MG-2023]MDO6527364.1 MBL fold metallo-hydrolase [Motilimonas sp. 1_MG-2023]
MEFTFFGTSAGTPTKARNVTALALRLKREKSWCLIDCGEGTQHQLLHAPYSLANLAAVFITHVHGDHCFGLVGLLASASLTGRKAPLTIYGPAALAQFIPLTLELTDTYLCYPIEFVDVESLDQEIEVAGFTVSAIRLSHRVPCHAWHFVERNIAHQLDQEKLGQAGIEKGPLWGKIQQGEQVRLADGSLINGRDFWRLDNEARSIIVAGDNDQPELLQQAAANANVLIHEATYTQAIADKVGPDPMHSSAMQLAKFAQQVALPNLVMTHFSARFGGEGKSSMRILQQEAKRFYHGELFLAEDLTTYQLNSKGELSKLTP